MVTGRLPGRCPFLIRVLPPSTGPHRPTPTGTKPLRFCSTFRPTTLFQKVVSTSATFSSNRDICATPWTQSKPPQTHACCTHSHTTATTVVVCWHLNRASYLVSSADPTLSRGARGRGTRLPAYHASLFPRPHPLTRRNGLAHPFATCNLATTKTYCGQPAQKRYGCSDGEEQILLL